ncbi:MAG: BlaI/MecI/CopY family transcriptional regulator [Vicinamibacterales bacterium]
MSETRLGPLESRVLEALWTRRCPCSVRDLQPAFPAIAYTTLMTTLDRLHRKGVLVREKQGRAFVYVPRNSRAQFRSAMLSFFLDTIGETDEALLDELERLIREKRKEEL